MNSSWRHRVRAQHRGETERWFDEMASEPTPSDVDIESGERANWLDAAHYYQIDLQTSEELTVRLFGNDDVASGTLRFDVGTALLRPIQDGVEAAAQTDVSLELVGISEGSTVLHVQPVKSTRTASDDVSGTIPMVDIEASHADPAINKLLDMITAIEARADVARWANMLSSIEALVTALDRFDLCVDLKWYRQGRQVRQSTLTDRGRRYVNELRETFESEQEVKQVAGRVVELKIAGVVKVKTAGGKKAPSYDVRMAEEELVNLHLQLGEQVAFLVRVVHRFDRSGADRNTSYIFMRKLDAHENYLSE